MAALEVKHIPIIIIAGCLLLLCTLYTYSSKQADFRFIPARVNEPDESVGNKTIVAYRPPSWFSIKVLNTILSTQCKYRNCLLTTNTTQLEKQDAILYSLTGAANLPREPPVKSWERNVDQVWIFFWLEPPPHHGGSYRNVAWRNAVNWTMSYTSDSDVIYPYGSVKRLTFPPSKDYHNIFKRKTKMVAWAVSHCRTQSQRERYVRKLREEGITVDIFGKCKGGNVTQADLKVTQDKLRNLLENKYKFYLGFENSFCKDYITEKFYKYFSYDIVVVVRGAENYSNLVPNDAVINTADFKSVKYLAAYLKTVAANETLYTEYLKSKDNFNSTQVLRHSDAVCSMCEKLNKLEHNRRVYTDLVERIHKGTCFKPNDF